MTRYDTVVIGAGMAGLTTACQLAQANQKVLLVSHGIGALLLASGCIDVLGFHPADALEPVTNPATRLADFVAARPDHPYAVVGQENIEAGLTAFGQLVKDLDYRGDLSHNWRLPSAVGALHPTCLAPAALAAGEVSQGGRWLIVGFDHLRDFYPRLLCDNLNQQDLGVQAEPLLLDLSIPVASPMNATPLEVAHAFEQAEFRQRVVKTVKGHLSGIDRVGFPAVLGLDQHRAVLTDLEKQLNRPVFEISALPPSVPGRRLFEALKQAFLQAGGRLIIGGKIVDGVIEAGRVSHIRLETASRLKPISAGHYVLATGGLFGGGLAAHPTGQIEETIFGLPVAAVTNRHHWFEPSFISPRGQPVFNAGLKVDRQLHPVNGAGPLAENLYAVGALLAGAEWASGRTGDGVALATAAAVVKQLIG